MRSLRRVVIGVLASLGMTAVAMAQAPSPTTPGAAAQPPPFGGSSAPSVAGRVEQYLLTPHGEVEGLLLADGTAVRFPPHLGVMLASTVRSGDNVSSVGFLGPGTSYGRALKALTITNTATGQTVVDQPPTSRPLPPHLRGLAQVPLSVSGTVSHFLTNPKGDVDGLVLATGEQVKFKPHHGALILTLLGRTGGAITASGYGARNAFGTVVAAESITVGTQTISLRGR